LKMTTRYVAAFAAACALSLAGCALEHPVGADWAKVREVTTCEALSPAACVGAAGFAVFRDGTWVIGPAGGGVRIDAAGVPAESGLRLDGQLTFAEKTLIASDIAQLDRERGPQCTAAASVPGVSDRVDLALPERDLRIFEKGIVPGQTCLGGGREAALRLHDDLSALMGKYYGMTEVKP
jgi:hypothetical protein